MASEHRVKYVGVAHGATILLSYAPPEASVSGCLPSKLNSEKLPYPDWSGAEIVPLPKRSPASRLQPPQVWWATICATVQ